MNRDKPKPVPSKPAVDDVSYRGALIVAPPSIIGAWAHNLFHDVAVEMKSPLQVRLLDKFDDVGPEEEWPQTLYLTQFPSAPVISILESGRMPDVAQTCILVWAETRNRLSSIRENGAQLR